MIDVTSASVGATGTFSLSLMGSVKLTVSPDPVAGSCKNPAGQDPAGHTSPYGRGDPDLAQDVHAHSGHHTGHVHDSCRCHVEDLPDHHRGGRRQSDGNGHGELG